MSRLNLSRRCAGGPGGASIIENKSYDYRSSDLQQVRSNAWCQREKLAVRCWFTALLCMNEERAAEDTPPG